MRARAQALPEYGLIVGIVAAAALAIFVFFGGTIINIINNFTKGLHNRTSG